ncbi:hypothetical protein [Terriglobus sp. ADX1]|uniref:hypothetical protein n=1 Tax=Terriglobus sp. ADX1 TaxID=2794063 RepID=UPI002FE5496F
MNAVSCSIALGMALSMGAVAGAQTSANGMATPPGTQNKTSATHPCANMDASGQPSTQAQVDAGCTGLSPNFVYPSTNMPGPEHHDVTAVIRVNSVVAKPDKFPYPMDFQVVGDATMLKAKLPQVRACLGVAKSWTKRANAATSTTCVDHKGEVLAYQECKPADGGVPMVCTTGQPGDPTVASMK